MTICSECHIAVMEPHPELHWWRKCPICGFSALLKCEIHPKYWAFVDRDPLMRDSFTQAIAIIEADQDIRFIKSLPSK